MTSIVPTFQGELQLAGWSESHNGGCKVTFWLADPSDLDAFRSLTVRKGNTAGHRLAAVLVEIGDDERPVDRQPSESGDRCGHSHNVDSPGSRANTGDSEDISEDIPKGRPLAKWAAMRCQEAPFRRLFGCATEDEMRARILIVCGIKSRSELDSNPAAAGLFKRNFMEPWRDRCTDNDQRPSPAIPYGLLPPVRALAT